MLVNTTAPDAQALGQLQAALQTEGFALEYKPAYEPLVVASDWESSVGCQYRVLEALHHNHPVFRLAGGPPFHKFLVRIYPEFHVTYADPAREVTVHA